MADFSIVDPTMSYTGVLAPNASFVGAFTDVTQWTSVTTTAISLVPPAAANAIQYEWSTDGINLDSTMAFGSDASTQQTVHSSIRAQYLRVRYTTGGSGSGGIRVQTLLRNGPINASVSRIGLVTGSPDALNTNAIAMGKATTTYQAIKAIPDPQTPTDFYMMVGPPPSATSVLSIRTVANIASVQIDFAGIGAPTRRALCIFNDTIRGNLHIKTSSPSSLTTYHAKIPPYHTFLMPIAWPTYRGAGATLFGIWDVADGACVVTEYV